jgi:hypothetical protein
MAGDFSITQKREQAGGSPGNFMIQKRCNVAVRVVTCFFDMGIAIFQPGILGFGEIPAK